MQKTLAGELGEALSRVLASGRYLLGPETEAFEAEFTRHEGGGHGVCCSSGSDALFLALRSLSIGEGDAVVTVSNSLVATPEAVARTGARVVFCDAGPHSRSLDPADLAVILSEPGADAIKAVIPVHLCGRRADMNAIREVLDSAGRSEITIIGDDGFVTSKHRRHAVRIRSLRNHERAGKHNVASVGVNSRFDEVQAAVLRSG